MGKLIITFVAGGIILNIVYIIVTINQNLLSKNPWYIFMAGIVMLVTAIIIRNRKT